MSTSDRGVAEALLGLVASDPSQILAAGQGVLSDAFPAGPMRLLWDELVVRASLGVVGPAEPDTVVALLVGRGVPAHVAASWWEGVRVRNQGADIRHVAGLAAELTSDHARRAVMRAAESAMKEMHAALSLRATAQDLREIMIGKLQETEQAIPTAGLVSVVEADRLSQYRLAIAAETGGEFGLSTGIDTLDEQIAQLIPGQLTVIAARAKVGKTHAAMHLVGHFTSVEWPHLGGRSAGVMIASLEMDATSVYDRLLAWESDEDYSSLVRAGSAGQTKSLLAARGRLVERNIHFLDQPGLTVGAIACAARSLARRAPIDVLVVDYLDLVKPSANLRERHDLQVGAIVRDLLVLGRELEAHVVLLVQINREGEQEATVRHLANSDEIGRAAHNILILNPDHRGDPLQLASRQKRQTHLGRLLIDVTSRGPGTGARVPVVLDKRTSRLRSSE